MPQRITDLACRRLVRSVECMLAVRAAAPASFDELDEAIDGVRESFERFTDLVLRPVAALHGEVANDDG